MGIAGGISSHYDSLAPKQADLFGHPRFASGYDGNLLLSVDISYEIKQLRSSNYVEFLVMLHYSA